ncbi:ABC transporter permease [Candidatus Poriferisocius sp.]|uniref:ABC transporter permease n=1 Tax=Candidatus Poriferisocius sp. TaxID=3101276 RepID=UPI003B59AFD3
MWLIIAPIVVLVWGSFSSSRPGAADFFSIGNLTFGNWTRAFDSELWEIFANTAVFAIGTTLLAFCFGTFLAWAVERTNTPFRQLITVLVLARLIVPGILTTVSWIFLASPRTGMINSWIESIFGIDQPLLDVYTMHGMIFVEALDVFPVSFLLMSAALRSMDPSLEEASQVAGHSTLSTTYRVTLPLILPAILATFIFLLIRGVETFETPTLIGLPAGIPTFVVEIWQRTSAVPTDLGLAGVYAVLVLMLAVVLVWGYNRVTRHSEAYQIVSGKAFRPKRIDLGRGRWVSFGLAALLLFLSVGLPLIVLAWASIQPPFSGVPPLTPEAAVRFGDFSLENYRDAFDSELTRRALWNSSILAVAAASIVTILMAIVAWITVKSNVRGRSLLDHLAFTPIAVPAIMFGLSVLWMYLILPFPVFGTLWILLILYVARFPPVAFRILSAQTTQIADELQEAAEVSGATWWTSFRTIILPLLKPGLLAAWIFVMVHAFRELGASVLVSSFGTEVVGVAILDLWENGSFGLLSAFGIVIMGVLLFAAVAAGLISQRYGVREY